MFQHCNIWVLGLALGLAACGSDDSSSGAGGAKGTGGAASGGSSGTGGSTGSGGNAGSDAGTCARTPKPADAIRKLVVSHPYDASGNPSGAYELFDLDPNGNITATGTTFELGRATTGEVVFTPDGELGFVATEDGKIGVFRVETDGAVTVLQKELAGSFYAAKLVMDPSGDRVWVLDDEWRDIGGGVYSLEIGCDDSVTAEPLAAPAKLPAAFAFSSKTPGRAFLAADDVLASPANQSLHLLDWSASPSLVASVQAFSADAPIISSLALSFDESYALISDNSGFSSVPNRVAVVKLGASTLEALQEVSPIEDPADIETSPFDQTALVTSGFGNALYSLSFDASKPQAPFSATKLSTSSKPELPVDMVQVRRGKLEGHVFVAEVSAIRQVVFAKGQAPSDVGSFALASGTENAAGAIGIQP